MRNADPVRRLAVLLLCAALLLSGCADSGAGKTHEQSLICQSLDNKSHSRRRDLA